MTLAALVSLITQAGAVVGALTVIVGAVIAVVRFFLLRPLKDHLDTKVGEIEKQFDKRLNRIDHELSPNGGGSMRDAVKRIETKVDSLGVALTAYEAKTSTYIRAQSTALNRQQIDAPNPDDFGID